MGEPATPTDIGHLIGWLWSDYARPMTGCDFTADGGAQAKQWGSCPLSARQRAPRLDRAWRDRGRLAERSDDHALSVLRARCKEDVLRAQCR